MEQCEESSGLAMAGLARLLLGEGEAWPEDRVGRTSEETSIKTIVAERAKNVSPFPCAGKAFEPFLARFSSPVSFIPSEVRIKRHEAGLLISTRRLLYSAYSPSRRVRMFRHSGFPTEKFCAMPSGSP